MTNQDVTCHVSPPPRHPGGLLSSHTTPQHYVTPHHSTTPHHNIPHHTYRIMINHIWQQQQHTASLTEASDALGVQYSDITKTVHLLNTTNWRIKAGENSPASTLLSRFKGYLCSNTTQYNTNTTQ